MEKNYIPLALTFLLLLIAIVLGWYIVKQLFMRKSTSNSNLYSVSQTTSPTIDTTQDTASLSDVSISFPSDNSTPQERQAFNDRALRLKVKTDTVTYNRCRPSPISVEVTKNSTVKFKNNNSYEITLFLDTQHTYKIGPSQILPVAIDFLTGTGAYGYKCATANINVTPSGVLYVMP